MRKFIFDKTIPYTFKEVSGLDDFDKVGVSILENGKVVGGIKFHTQSIGDYKTLSLSAIEILPDQRNKGKGTEIVNELLTKAEIIICAVQEKKAFNFWKKQIGAKIISAVVYPEDKDKPNPRFHTLVFIIGKNDQRIDNLIRLIHFSQMGNPENITSKVGINDLREDFFNKKTI